MVYDGENVTPTPGYATVEPQFEMDPVKRPVFSTPSRREWWVYILFIGALLFLIGMAIFLGITEGYYIAIIICAQLMFFFLIILILPKRLEVWYDSVKVDLTNSLFSNTL